MSGTWFEDLRRGQTYLHPGPRTIHGGDLSLYLALAGDRNPLTSSTELARSLGFHREVVPPIFTFHLVRGRSLADLAPHALGVLGPAEVRFARPVYPGDTLIAESQVVAARPSGSTGTVVARTRGLNQKGQEVLSFVQHLEIALRQPPSPDSPAASGSEPELPILAGVVAASELAAPDSLNLQRYFDLSWTTGSTAVWGDFTDGERLVHASAATIEPAERSLARRLYQGHTPTLGHDAHDASVALALAQDDLGSGLVLAAINGIDGAAELVTTAATPATIAVRHAVSDIVAHAELGNRRDLGALRVRTALVRDTVADERRTISLGTSGGPLDPRVELVLDYWLLMPRRAP